MMQNVHFSLEKKKVRDMEGGKEGRKQTQEVI
jgi:hypothetical protein